MGRARLGAVWFRGLRQSDKLATPAKAGAHALRGALIWLRAWIPAFTGMAKE